MSVIIRRVVGEKQQLKRDLNEMQIGYAKDTDEMIVKFNGEYRCYKPDTEMHIASQLVHANKKYAGTNGIPKLVWNESIKKYVVEFGAE